MDMKRTIDERVELQSFNDKMKYVKMQMHHAKTNKLKNYNSGAKGPKDDPMGLGNVGAPDDQATPPPPSTLEQLLAKLSVGQDTMINALKGKGGKGYGENGYGGAAPNKGDWKGNPKGGKPGKGKGKDGKGGGGAKGAFAGNCYECGVYGHRAFECPKKRGLNSLGGDAL